MSSQGLRDKGIAVTIGHDAANLGDAAVVVTSTAIKRTNPEVAAAIERRIPVVRRAEMLAELMRLKSTVAIAGTHGKTTTTSMIAALLDAGGMDPTVINGGIINTYGSNARLGAGEWMVVEADESDGSFLRLHGTIGVVTNIDPEHLDHYGDFERVKAAFVEFVEHVPFYGAGILCLDHPEVQALLPKVQDRRIITYGFSAQADVRGDNVTPVPGGNRFTAIVRDRAGAERRIEPLVLPMPGRHNVQNALAAIAVAVELGIDDAAITAGFARFGGVKRRFTRVGEVALPGGSAIVIDDYGHHPVEIRAVLAAAREGVGIGTGGRVIAVVQPHRFTRLRDLMGDFQTAFNDADMVIVAPGLPRRRGPDRGRRRRRARHRAEARRAPQRRDDGRARRAGGAARRDRRTRRHGRLPRRGRHHEVGGGPRHRHRGGAMMALAEAPAMPALRGSIAPRASLADFIWFRTGGAAEWLVRPADVADLQGFLRDLPADVPVMAVGVGSNLIVRDGGVAGVVVRLPKTFATVTVDGTTVRAGAAAMGITVATAARDAGLAGLEFLRGIPGTVGGAVRMNAGAYGREVADCLIEATVVCRDGSIVTCSAAELGFAYRHSAVPVDAVIVAAVFAGVAGSVAAIDAEMSRIVAEREASQPLRSRTGGSTFANPPGHKAWALIDAAGCRGLRHGGAQVSEKHTNFLINTGDATSADLEGLGNDVRARVMAHSGIDLRWEIVRVGVP